jgi:hypothetical protein
MQGKDSERGQKSRGKSGKDGLTPVKDEEADAAKSTKEASTSSKQKTNIQRLVMEEVARTLRDQELRSGASSSSKRFSVFHPGGSSAKDSDNYSYDGTGGGGDPNRLESDKLAGIRYELLKIQQELLRRQVLDPKYYKATSLDTTVAEGGRPSAGDYNNNRDAKQSDNMKRYTPICEQEIPFGDGTKGIVEVMHDLMNDNVLIRLLRLVNLDRHGQEIDPEKLANGEEVVVRVGREAFAFMRVSRLLLNRITSHTLETISQESKNDHRLTRLDLLLHQVRTAAVGLPLPRGRLSVHADRLLFVSQLTTSGVLASLEIRRNDECTGIILTVNPTVNLMAITSTSNSSTDTKDKGMGGPITLMVTDKELQVLLINQRALYLLAQSKWSCMEMVAQWLASRIVLKRVRVLDVEEESVSSAVGGNKKVLKAQKLHMTNTQTGTALLASQGLLPAEPEPAPSPSPTGRDSMKKGKSQRFQLQSSKSSKSMNSSTSTTDNTKASPNPMSTSLTLPPRSHDHKDDDDISVESGTHTQASGTLTFEQDDPSATLGAGGSTTLSGGKFIDTIKNNNYANFGFSSSDPVLLDLKLDRRVDIAKTALQQWKCRNIPVIHGKSF